MPVDPAHDRAFFEEMRGQREPYRRLADAIHATLGVHLALDIGCGVGCVTARLAELGWIVTGADAAPAAFALREPGFVMMEIDLTSPPVPWGHPWDVVLCTETAEHVSEDAAELVVEHCAGRATEHVVWSAAPPGATWPGHVNCKPGTYWLSKFKARGWTPDLELTGRLRREMIERAAQHSGGADNFYILSPFPYDPT